MHIARSKQFQKQYRKLPVKMQRQFGERLMLFMNDKSHPLLHTHALTGKYLRSHSFNVTADIRAVFIFKNTNIVYFSAIGSHRELYE